MNNLQDEYLVDVYRVVYSARKIKEHAIMILILFNKVQ